MKVDTRWFGTIDIDDEKIITFDLGVIGFEDCKKFTLIYDVDKGDEASIMWLQSLDEPELALPMLKPELIKEDYDPIVEDEMLKALGSRSFNTMSPFCSDSMVVFTVALRAAPWPNALSSMDWS